MHGFIREQDTTFRFFAYLALPRVIFTQMRGNKFTLKIHNILKESTIIA